MCIRDSVYAAGGYYYPGQDHGKLKDEMRSDIDRGYTVVKKIPIAIGCSSTAP